MQKITDMQTLLELATKREAEANRFYADLAQRVSDKAVAGIFTQLAKEEKAHEELMWKLRADGSLTLKFKAPEDFGLAETLDLPELSVEMKPAEALALAAKKEQQAVDLYQRLSEWATDGALKDTCLQLAEMEKTHKHRLENLYVDVGYPEVW